MIKLKQVQKLLIDWGKYWSAKEFGAGFGSNSVTGRCMEIMKTGVQSSGTAHQVSDRADSIQPPPHIEEIEQVLTSLTTSERHWLRIKYIKHANKLRDSELMKYRNQIIDSAETKMCGLL